MAKILVTGGCGFIGSHTSAIKTLKWILKRGFESQCKYGFNWFKCNLKS